MTFRRRIKDLKPKRLTEGGNVLFLILIAVALFGALSYAVTYSSNNSPGGTSDSSGQIKAAQINHYPNVVQTQILRMVMNKIEIEDLQFNPPSRFGALTDLRLGVFHPQFGTNYVRADPDVMASGSQGDWFFNMHFEINNIGTSAGGSLNGNEIIAFLPGVHQNICQRVNERFQLNTIPTVNNAAYYDDAIEYMDEAYLLPTGENIIGDTILPELDGQPFGCYQETSTSNLYIYYYTLIER